MTCAQAAVEAGYQFFIQDPNDGQCLAETTESGECPEGISTSSYYDFYAAYGYGEPTPEPETEVIEEELCEGESMILVRSG
jgi:hypothetical protein